MVYKGKIVVFFPTRIGYFFAKMFFGKEEADRRMEQFIRPKMNKRIGIYTIIGGGILLVGGLYYLYMTIPLIFFA
jgi:hypothetical protein